jgi:hypothetical protein
MQTEGSANLELGSGWRVVEMVDEAIDCGGVTVHRSGLTAEGPAGRMAVGSAADLDGFALQRAKYELLERACLVDALCTEATGFESYDVHRNPCGTLTRDHVFPVSPDPERWQHARSNGVAVGQSWAAACRSAAFEAFERERILQSWYDIGAVPKTIKPEGVFAEDLYEWQLLRIPGPIGSAEVVFALGLPRRKDVPLLRGAGAAWTLDEARARAMRECVQGLAFLWGEEIPNSAPEPAPTAMYHLDHYLWPGSHGALRRWAISGRGAVPVGPDLPYTAPMHALTFVDLTPPALRDRVCVVKAQLPHAIPLVFGDHCPVAGAPADRRIHPIP